MSAAFGGPRPEKTSLLDSSQRPMHEMQKRLWRGRYLHARPTDSSSRYLVV
jgi:hypothetical protein